MQDGSGSIEAEELSGFAKDMLSLMKPVRSINRIKFDQSNRSIGLQDCTLDEVEKFKRLLLDNCDLNNDEKIEKDELTMMLMAIQKMVKI